MTADEALAFVRDHGVVLVSAKGPVPRLVEAIVGEPIKGSWWAHPKSHRIYSILQTVTASKEILVCRLIERKVTLVHRRLWPALCKVAERFEPDRVSRVCEEHTASGRHVTHEVAFPEWVPADVKAMAEGLSDVDAMRALGEWAETTASPRRA